MNIQQLRQQAFHTRSAEGLDRYWIDPIDREWYNLQCQEWFCGLCGEQVRHDVGETCLCWMRALRD